MVFYCLYCCHLLIEIMSFICTNRINLPSLKRISDRLALVAKGFLKLPNLLMLIKQKVITSQKLSSQNFYQIANSVLNEGESAMRPFNGLVVLSSASDKAKLLAGNFSKNSNLDDSVISSLAFTSRTNPLLHNIPSWL